MLSSLLWFFTRYPFIPRIRKKGFLFFAVLKFENGTEGKIETVYSLGSGRR